MLRTIGGKRLQLLVLTLIMSAFLILTTSFAFGDGNGNGNARNTIYSTSAWINAETGGSLSLSNTMGLTVPAGALSTNTVLTASFAYDKKTNIFLFDFGPSPMSFNISLQLFMSWSDLDKFGLSNDPTLYYDGIPVASSESDWGVTYYLDHFSIYYFERR